MVNNLLPVSLGPIYVAENTLRSSYTQAHRSIFVVPSLIVYLPYVLSVSLSLLLYLCTYLFVKQLQAKFAAVRLGNLSMLLINREKPS